MSQGLRLLSAISEHGSTTTFRQLDEELLVDDDERAVYLFMQRHYRRHSRLPSLDTIEEETRVEMPDTEEPIEYYLQDVHKRHIYNRARDEFSTLRQAITNTDVDAISSSAVQIRQICTPYSGQQHELQTVADLSTELLEDYDRLHYAPEMSGVPTGWAYLDRAADGFQNGDLVVLVARPSVGKTTLLVHSARAAWSAGKSVLFVSMEMTLKQIAMRFAAQHSGLEPDYIRKGKLSFYGRRRYERSLNSLSAADNFHLYAGNFKKNTADLDSIIQELNPDAVYIDGIYLMKPANANARSNRFESSAYVVDELKQIALMRERPLIATTQFGRSAGKRGEQGSLENIGYTDAIGTHASIIVGIKMGAVLSKPVVEQTTAEDGSTVNTVIGHREVKPYRVLEVLKGRENESGEFGIQYRFAPTNFSDVPLEIATGGSNTEGTAAPSVDYMLP
jgi:replicative DNA helicase